MSEKQTKKVTKYEKARLIGARALQISMGAPFLIELNKEQLEALSFSPLEIAKLEYEKGVIPIEIKVTLPYEKRIETKNIEITPNIGKQLESVEVKEKTEEGN